MVRVDIALELAMMAQPGSAGDMVDDAEAVQTVNEDDDIIAIGKSCGREVGQAMTLRKAVPVTIIDHDQIEARNLVTREDVLTAANGIAGVTANDTLRTRSTGHGNHYGSPASCSRRCG